LSIFSRNINHMNHARRWLNPFSSTDIWKKELGFKAEELSNYSIQDYELYYILHTKRVLDSQESLKRDLPYTTTL